MSDREVDRVMDYLDGFTSSSPEVVYEKFALLVFKVDREARNIKYVDKLEDIQPSREKANIKEMFDRACEEYAPRDFYFVMVHSHPVYPRDDLRSVSRNVVNKIEQFPSISDVIGSVGRNLISNKRCGSKKCLFGELMFSVGNNKFVLYYVQYNNMELLVRKMKGIDRSIEANANRIRRYRVDIKKLIGGENGDIESRVIDFHNWEEKMLRENGVKMESRSLNELRNYFKSHTFQ